MRNIQSWTRCCIGQQLIGFRPETLTILLAAELVLVQMLIYLISFLLHIFTVKRDKVVKVE